MTHFCLALQLMAGQVGQQNPPPASTAGDPVSPCDVWRTLDSKVGPLTDADTKEAGRVDALMREGKIEAGDQWSNAMNASSDDHNALQQIESSLKSCDYLVKQQRGVCENQIATAQLPDCVLLGNGQRRANVPCRRHAPGEAQPAPVPTEEAVSSCLAGRMEQLAKDNATRAQPFVDWLATQAAAKATTRAKEQRIAGARANPALMLKIYSAYLCTLTARKGENAAAIKKEQKYATKYSGFVNKVELHERQEKIEADDGEIGKVRGYFGGRKPMSCKDPWVAANAACIRSYLDAADADADTGAICDAASVLFGE